MKPTLRFGSFVLLGLFLFGFSAQNLTAQKSGEYFSEPQLPEGYKQWPNVFERQLKSDNGLPVTLRVYARKYVGGEKIEFLNLIFVDKVIVWSVHYNDIVENSQGFVLVGPGYYQGYQPETMLDAFSKGESYLKERFGLTDFFGEWIYEALMKLERELGIFFDRLTESPPPDKF